VRIELMDGSSASKGIVVLHIDSATTRDVNYAAWHKGCNLWSNSVPSELSLISKHRIVKCCDRSLPPFLGMITDDTTR
jgi:hypothetical protein